MAEKMLIRSAISQFPVILQPVFYSPFRVMFLSSSRLFYDNVAADGQNKLEEKGVQEILEFEIVCLDVLMTKTRFFYDIKLKRIFVLFNCKCFTALGMSVYRCLCNLSSIVG